MSNKIVIFLIGLILLFACNEKTESEAGTQPLARVFDKYLYLDEIMKILPKNITRGDSTKQVKQYVETWVKKQLLIKKAELNLTEEQKDVSEQLEDYRTSLLIHKYKKKLTSQKLDTVISDEEIQEYYDNRMNEFKLTNHAVKALYIQIPISKPDIYIARRYYRSEKERDKTKLDEYCFQHAAKFDDFENGWVYFSAIVKDIPVTIEDNEVFLKYNKFIESQDSAFVYLVNIKEYRLKGDVAPLKFVKDNIKTIILNKRKVDLLNNLENSLFQDGLSHKNIEIFKEQ